MYFQNGKGFFPQLEVESMSIFNTNLWLEGQGSKMAGAALSHFDPHLLNRT